MADDDPTGRHALFLQERNLLQGELAEVSGMSHDTGARAALRSCRRAEYAFLCRRDMLPLSPDLSDDAGADICSVRALSHFTHDQIGERIGIFLEDDGRIKAFAVPACSHDDLDTSRFRDASQGAGITAQAAARGIDESTAAGLAIFR